MEKREGGGAVAGLHHPPEMRVEAAAAPRRKSGNRRTRRSWAKQNAERYISRARSRGGRGTSGRDRKRGGRRRGAELTSVRRTRSTGAAQNAELAFSSVCCGCCSSPSRPCQRSSDANFPDAGRAAGRCRSAQRPSPRKGKSGCRTLGRGAGCWTSRRGVQCQSHHPHVRLPPRKKGEAGP